MRVPNLKFLALTAPEIWRGYQNFKSRSRDPLSTPFGLILHYFVYFPQWSICLLNFKFLASTVHEIWGGPKILKVGRITLSRPLFLDLILHFSLRPRVANLCAKFEVYSFNRSRDMELVPKFTEWPSVRLSRLKTRFLASYSSVDNSVCRRILIYGWPLCFCIYTTW